MGQGRRCVAALAVAAVVAAAGAAGAAIQTPTGPVRVAAAGDIACDPDVPRARGECADAETAELLEGADAVLMLGDGQYPDGALERYRRGYGRTWGRFLDRTWPVPGNHEYGTRGARGYFAYFGERAGPPGLGFYSVRLGGWRVLAVNSNCWAVGGCGPGSPQYRWLIQELAAGQETCVLAFWHHPRFSWGRYRGYGPVAPVWEALYQHGAELVLTAHDHNYQRFAQLDAAGRADERGVRQFVVGTGGRNLYRARRQGEVRPELLRDDRFGVLRLELYPDRYTWEFVTSRGEVLDRGASRCR